MEFKFESILITGGAGFLGSSLALAIKSLIPKCQVICLDNLIRKGSHLQLPRLEEAGITFIKGDVRNPAEWNDIKADLIVECSAEPSVQAGMDSSPQYLLDTNLSGAINCLEWARKNKAQFLFISTSRVYPVALLQDIPLQECDTRFHWCDPRENEPYRSLEGLTLKTPTNGGYRSLYGSSKLAAEMLVEEYVCTYGLAASTIRFGVIAGPWQMGKVDQGFLTYWLAAHLYRKPLKYFGFGGSGKQVRGVLHIKDAVESIIRVISDVGQRNLYQIAGGLKHSISLMELTGMAQQISDQNISIESIDKTHKNDVPVLLLDGKSSYEVLNWEPEYSLNQIVEDTYQWLVENRELLKPVFGA
tara:strand:- start:924 stop:2000 length:1077 start_codon:yes stop_codon:yes gene_type:complete